MLSIFALILRQLFKVFRISPVQIEIRKSEIQFYMGKDHIVRSERISSAQLAENTLKEHKKRVGKVVHVAISNRTTFEFPEHLSQEEREIRIENYKKRHKPMI